jgi:apolipoprotein N-acyltransferase
VLLLHWMAVALWQYSRWSVLGFVAIVLWLAAATGTVFAAGGWLRRRTGLPVLLVFPVLWTTMEWLLAHQGPGAFTWLGLGTSLTGYPELVQVADIFGARGVTFLLAATNAALAVAWVHRRQQARAAILVAAVAIGGLGTWLYGAVRMHQLDLRSVGKVAVVQTDVGPRDKWVASRSDLVVGQALELSRRTMDQRPDLIVWPETSLPGVLLYHPEWDQAIGELAQQASAFVLVGGIEGVPKGRGLEQYNAAYLFDPRGRQTMSPYRKQRLVPLFEWGNGLEAGGRSVPYLTPHGRIGVLICLEATSESMARRYRRQGADVLVNLSNDAWFSVGGGAHQHAAHLVMRAIETRMGIARAANRGISEIVDPLGRIQQQVPRGTTGTAVDVLATTATMPLYVRLGDWVGPLSGLVTLAFLAFAARRQQD